MDNTEKLIKVYQESQQQLINLIAYKEARGNVIWYQETLLKQVQQILTQLNAYSADWVREAINESYLKGVLEAIHGLDKLGVKLDCYEAFAKLHTASVELLIANTRSMLFDATSFVGRQIQDSIRQAGLEAIALKQATGSTVKEAARIVKQKLVEQGLNGIQDKRGKMISLDVYAETVARSTTREATNQAMLNHLQYNEYDLVKMSSHATTCSVCAAYQGRVYSISGKSPDYPALSIPFSGGHANIHPRCRHVLMPYIPSLADDAEGDKTYSNRSFDIDDRSKTTIQKYNDNQTEKRKLRLDRNQWEQYKLALGEDAPKTLSAFRNMKQANSEKFQQLQKDYQEFNKQV